MVTGQCRRHVAAACFPFASHPAALLLLVRHLAASSPDVLFTFFGTKDCNKNMFKDGGSGANLPPNVVPHVVHDGIPDGHVVSDMHRELMLFLKGAKESFKKGMEEAEAMVGVKISCVVSEALMWFCGGIAADKGASWVAFWICSATSLSAHLHIDDFRAKFGTQDVEEDDLVGTVPGFSMVRFSDLPEGVVLGDFSSPLSQMVYNMATALPNATATIVNLYEELEWDAVKDLKIMLKKCINVGPLSLLFPHQATRSDDYGCIPFLEGRDHASVAYIAFGTLATPPPHELVALAKALEASRITFIWSLKDNDVAHLPKEFKERTDGRGKVVPWAPQVALLAHQAVGVFVNHGGWASVTESIFAGVPMICRPFFADQFLNTRYVETVWKIGTAVDVFTKTGTLDALERVIRTEEGKQMRANVAALKSSVEAAVPLKGSSNKNLESLIELVTE
ncbi:Flavonol 3-O-glucosyltransferase-like protein [Drosera capensis]